MCFARCFHLAFRERSVFKRRDFDPRDLVQGRAYSQVRTNVILFTCRCLIKLGWMKRYWLIDLHLDYSNLMFQASYCFYQCQPFFFFGSWGNNSQEVLIRVQGRPPNSEPPQLFSARIRGCIWESYSYFRGSLPYRFGRLNQMTPQQWVRQQEAAGGNRPT